MRVGCRETKLELSCPLLNCKGVQGHAAKVEVELACAGLDRQGEGLFLTEL
jgi:hypothetical protein